MSENIDQEVIWGALHELPEPQFAAVALRDILGHPYQRVADAMGIPVEQARTHVMQARMALKNSVFSE